MTTTTPAGLDHYCYYNSGTDASPVWVLMTRVHNVTVTPDKGEITIESRASAWRKDKGGLKGLAANVTYLKKTGADTVFDVLLASFVSGTANQYYFADGLAATSGTIGWRAFMEVFGMEEGQELETISEYSFALKLTEHEESGSVVEPAHYEIPA